MYHLTIVISEATAARLGPEIILGRTASMTVKGKEKPVTVVKVLGAALQEQAEVPPPVGSSAQANSRFSLLL